MTMGKGGVGKTTVAARIAGELARRGLPVTLTTTDPAAHVDEAVRELGAKSSKLRVTRIDPELETRRYTEEVLVHGGQGPRRAGQGAPRRGSPEPVHRGDRRVPCVRGDGGPGRGPDSSSSTPRPRATPCCCSTPPSRTTARCCGSPAAARRRSSASCRACAIRRSRASCSSPSRRRRPSTRRCSSSETSHAPNIKPFAWVVNQSLTPLPADGPPASLATRS